jgi:hypothetical protein
VSKQVQKYKGLLDMIDGGGAGAVGNKFEGGGLFSLLANALGTPYGSEDRMRDAMQAQRPMARPTGGFGNGSIASASAGSAPAPGYTPHGTLAEMSNLAGDRAMPLTRASDIPGGFNPANAAPVQPSAPGMTSAPSVAPDFTMPDGSPINPPVPQLSREQIAQKFGDDMVSVYGRDTANSIMSSPSAQGIYLHYINNGYQLPEL